MDGVTLPPGPVPLPASRRLGILGGTFDPPHLAHLVVAQEILSRLSLDRVYFVPAGQPPHKIGRTISPAEDRFAMVQHAIAANTSFAVSRVDIDRPGLSYTSDTLRLLRAQWPAGAEITLILGWDMVRDLPNWHEPASVVAQVTRFAVTHRPGYAATPVEVANLDAKLPGLSGKLTIVAMPQLEISASAIRARVASGLPIRYLVPDTVVDYIARHALYRDAANSEASRDEIAHSDEEGGEVAEQ